jgi:Tol biopolymer transport system component
VSVTEVAFSDNVAAAWYAQPVFSQVPYDDRLIFKRIRSLSPYVLYDIWQVTVPSDYTGWRLPPKAITNKSNTQTTWGMSRVAWSPDGQWIAYTAYQQLYTMSVTYKLRSDGSGKSVALTNTKKGRGEFILLRWFR